MKLHAMLATLALVATAPTAHAGDVAVSVQIGQPGFYGRIDIGQTAPPPVIYREPVWVRRQPVVVEPVYLRVPPGHQRHWAKHCERYGACGQPVYFVREDWYQEHYERRHDEREDREQHRHRGHGRDRD